MYPMGLLDHIPYSGVVGRDRAQAAMEVVPQIFAQGEKAPKYRAHLLDSYAERNGKPPRRTENGEYRTPKETRLDRAWQDVADRMDRSEDDIRACVLGIRFFNRLNSRLIGI